ncbi:thymidine phosphorylase [Sulfobacillus harzensis]|uniref:Pyrimidine-nucleoside phosphorylase n=1 Tax=Sulfobacillus harzensis TaxID=2729629 RepID=A0A7Y0Q3E8_9FIRM|nr:thymidine phosphorylase [Sulfobacillus harzensis]NMP24168.1 thymidine phosphorylase [Sulfobacillus harzensis]
MIEVIEAARDRKPLPAEKIREFVQAVVGGRVPDYQIAAWLMAVYLNGLDEASVFALTAAMADEGTTPPRMRGRVDKHSTGGVGDKTTLILAPLVSSLGIPLLKMSGRGLGHTGGTLDKLEAIPGFRVTLDDQELARQMDEIGVAVVAQSAWLAPCDGIFYALRDVTGTVDSLPLIASSIMSKKMAGGAPNLVLDVKVGSGALMKDHTRARQLAELMLRIGASRGIRVTALLTNMDQPLGQAVGNAVEVMEALACLSGQGPEDLREEVLTLASHMVSLAQMVAPDEARLRVEKALDGGQALEQWQRWVRAQGGDWLAAERGLPLASSVPVTLGRRGVVAQIDTEAIGRAAQWLGAGRQRKDDRIDPSVGIRWYARLGQSVEADEPVCEVLAPPGIRRDQAMEMLRQAVAFGSPRARSQAVLDIVSHA